MIIFQCIKHMGREGGPDNYDDWIMHIIIIIMHII